MSNVDGSWNVEINTPMGTQKPTLNLTTDGTNLTGSMAGDQGTLELEDGKVDGDVLTWKASLTQPMAITLEFSCSVNGDEIAGTVKLGAFGEATLKGTRA
ncbi:MAG: hypothetical protein CMD77_04030 [Gammaproteobacteria bacterium]|nr:hypothetical protein [Gammaproteobacteria bacterium]MCH2351603.1 hypothetical protein [Pseudomonadales bacterium]HAO55096.1 hypothetical protein [Gammaproteobacteria bacterium]|tara:strand:- start:1910 stop:2209 length:300 start_codon:yes stop_codon:yes gene_type:complete